MSKSFIENGKAVLGIELGSTRVKAVLIDASANVLAKGSYSWENKFEKGVWTYSMDDVKKSVQGAYKDLLDSVKHKYGVKIKKLKAIGFSAMMHGYIVLDKNDKLLVPFRTWRNTITEEAAKILSKEFKFNIPQRWSVAHLYQAILNKEKHINDIAYITTLAGYLQYKLTGEKVVGIGEASGMFPIDSAKNNYNKKYVDIFNKLLKKKSIKWTFDDIFPKVLLAGENAGTLTKEGAKFLDPSGSLMEGCPLCPPEGDAGTGMVATNSIKVGTGNVSAGTSIFSMIVLEKALKSYYEEIDMVTTPMGKPVAMVHCNNCTNDINAWLSILRDTLALFGKYVSDDELYANLFKNISKGDLDCGGVINVPFLSGEPVVHLNSGYPMTLATAGGNFNLKNFVRALLYGAFATLKVGNDILIKKEKVRIDNIYGHGGLFTQKEITQKILANALKCKVSCMATAGEGGAWGMAILALYMVNGKVSLESFLQNTVFKKMKVTSVKADTVGVKAFDRYIENFKKAIKAEEAIC